MACDASLAALGSAVPQFLANCHTIFNVLLAAICLPFTPQIADFVVWSLAKVQGGGGDDAADPSRSKGKGKGSARGAGAAAAKGKGKAGRSPSPGPRQRKS